MFHRMIVPLILACTLFSTESARALTEEQIGFVKNAVIELCRGGTLTGSGRSYKIEGEGNITAVVIKNLVEAGVDAKLTFQGEEWNGIKADITKGYVSCVNTNLPRFLEKLE